MRYERGETLTAAPLVLVADADDEAGRSLAAHFARRGFRATHTAVGADVLDLAHDGRLGAVVVDVTLDDMSGHALVSRLKEIDPRLPVLMTTADERPEFVRQSELLANVWTGLGVDMGLTREAGRHHFNVIDGLTDPGSDLVEAVVGHLS